MAKRNTTGMPSASKKRQIEHKAPENENVRRLGILGEFETRTEQEEAIQRLITRVTIAAIAIIVLALLGALLWEFAIVPNQAVAKVNGETIRVNEFRERVRMERMIMNYTIVQDVVPLSQEQQNFLLGQEPYASYWQEINQPDLLGSRVVDDLILERLVRAEIENLGLTVSEEEIDEQIESFFNFDREAILAAEFTATPTLPPTETATPFVSPTPRPTETATPTPTSEPTAEATEETTDDAVATEEVLPTLTSIPTIPPAPTLTIDEREVFFNEGLDSFYRTARTEAGLSRDTVRDYFAYQALLVKLREAVIGEADGTAPFVSSRHILVETEEEAETIMASLDSGESFADLAPSVSIDTGSGAQGGELDWAPTFNYVDGFREAVEEAPIGEIVGPVESQFGFHIIQVRARENREVSEAQQQQAQVRTFSEWLQALEDDQPEGSIERTDAWIGRVPLNPVFSVGGAASNNTP